VCYYTIDVLLPTRTQGYWIVHDESESLQKQAGIDAGKFILHDLAMDGVSVGAVKAAEGYISLYLGIGSIIPRYISLYLGICSIIDALTGYGSDDPPVPIDVTAINIQHNKNRSNLNSLSSSSTLSINIFNSTTTSILCYINNFTKYSTLNSNGLDVSVISILYGSTTLLSSLNIPGSSKLIIIPQLAPSDVARICTLLDKRSRKCVDT
jgi:hypothetical protein